MTTLGLFSLGGSAFAGENGQGADHRSDRAAAATSEERGKPSDGDAAPVTEDTDTGATDEGGVATDNNIADEGDNRHPSGKDRSVETGGSGNQGNSTSAPDQDGNGPERDFGGTDKPGGPGGDDLNDQDGNNGCGNDDDFEDDNEGLCGGKRPVKTTPPVVGGEEQVKCPEGSTMPTGGTTAADCEKEKETVTVVDSTKVTPGAVLGNQLQNEAPATLATSETPATQVLGVTIERATPAEVAAVTAAPETQVLGVSIQRGGVLARTGFGLTVAGLIGLGLVAVGAFLQRAGRREHGTLA